MWLIHTAMRRPVTILMVIVGVALCSILAIQRMPADIFPDLGTPVIYVAQPYGGLDPAQMEGYVANYYEYHFLYVRDVDYVESRSIQSASIMKLYFHEGTDMAQAMAETVAQVNRARAFMADQIDWFRLQKGATLDPVYAVFGNHVFSERDLGSL